MKVSIIVLVVCAFMFCGVGIASADALASLEERVATLEAKDSSGALGELKVGGHLMMYMYDQSTGEVTNSSGVKTDQHNNASAGLKDVYLYLDKELSDIVQLNVAIDVIDIRASATPSLGSNITRATSTTTSSSLHTGTLTMLLPQDYELKVGTFYPIFAEEYARETWWHEQYHQNDGLSYLQSWQDTGMELYKNFEFDEWSLPVYLNLLNGQANVDNNDGKTILVHVAPELFNGALRIPFSYGVGKRDTEDDFDLTRIALGANYTYEKFNLSGEMYSNKYENITATEDGDREGYYLRCLYSINNKWKALVKYSYAELYKTGGTVLRTDEYSALTLALNYNITESSTIIPQVSFIEADRTGSTVASENNEKLEYVRWTLGWRTTF
ncbi:MAG: hypothetical protein KKD05_05610 [Candidatus Omnitrophica bacterium]|nr:hypothetical protein [Candidatus Omnitrophota bacterium]